MIRKVLSLLLVTSLMFSMMIVSVTAAQDAAGGQNQDGFIAPIDDPDPDAIEISTPEDLANISANMYGSYILTADIDMSSYGNWVAIGKTPSSAFHGKLDGQGHTVSGLTVEVDFNSGTLLAPYYAVGLFGVCDGAQIKNIILEDVDVSVNTTSGYRYDYSIIDSDGTVFAGGIVGYAINNTVIFNSSVSGKISSKASGEGYSPTVAGGLAGFLDSGILSYCYNSASVDSYNGNAVMAENGYAGGLIGRITEEAAVDCSYNTGAVTARVLDYGVSYAGGLIAEAASASVTVTNCFNSGEVKAMSGNNFSDPSYAGGIAADFKGSVTMCYNSGLVTAQISDPWGINSVNAYAGGICGHASSDTSITACAINNSAVYVSTSGTKYQYRIANGGIKSNNVSTNSYAAGSNMDADTYVPLEELKTITIYVGTLDWDFTNTWEMIDGVDFPQLKQVDTNSDAYRDEYIQQHLAFIQSSTYSDILNNHRWAKIYWSEENNFYSNLGGFLYKTTDSLVKLSQLKFGEIFDDDDPFVLILSDYVSNHNVDQTVLELSELELPYKMDETFSKLSKFIKSHWQNAWGELSDEDLFYLYHYDEKSSDEWITEHFEEHLEEIVAPEKENVIADLFDFTSYVTDTFIASKEKYNSIAKWVNGFFTYAANVKAYVDASMEFHTILETMQDNLPSRNTVESFYKLRLKNALHSYTQYNNESFLTLKLFMNYEMDCKIESFKSNLKKTLNDSLTEWVKSAISETAFKKLNTIGWAADKTWKICEYVTKNGELQECREMLKANAYFEEAAYQTLLSLQNRFTTIQNFENACIFDAAFKFLKETELYSMDTVIKYMDTYQCSWIQAIRNRSNTFMNSAIEEVYINKLFLNNTYCHGNQYFIGGKMITVACPTNVFVYDDSDHLIASVEDNDVSYCSSDSLAYTANAVKLFAVSSGKTYHVCIDATDSGTMDYSVVDYDEQLHNTQASVYTNIPLNEGDSFNGEIADSNGEQPNAYYLTDSDSNTVEGLTTVTEETNIPVESISVTVPKLVLQTGEQMQCTANITPSNATLPSVVWHSSSPDVASVSPDGKITAFSEGRAVISAQSIYGGVASDNEIIVISEDHSLIITDQPQDSVYAQGEIPETLSFACYQVNNDPVTIQWYMTESTNGEGQQIDSATTSALLPDTKQVGTYYYYAKISDGHQIVTTKAAKITVTEEKIIASGASGEINWELTENMRLIISGCGALSFDEDETVPWEDFRNSVKEIIVAEGITSIGETAFQNHSDLNSIVFPHSILSFSEGILSGCGSLCELVIPFIGTDRSTSRTANSVLGMLFGKVSEGGTVQYYTISGTSLSGYQYGIPSTLQKVTVTDADTIPFGAFYNCGFIESIELYDGITTIDDYAFYACSGLTTLKLPDSLALIGDEILGECENIRSLSIPFIGKTADSDNSSEAVLGYLFGNASDGTQQYLSMTDSNISVNSFAIPQGLEEITVTSAKLITFGAFSNCSNLKSVYLNSGIASIGRFAFLNCVGLEELTLPDSLQTIGESALKGCHSLKSLSVPFVGSNRMANGSFDGAFGFIFGRSSPADSNYCVQYSILDGNSLTGYGYAVPDSIEEIIITDASQIPVGAFCNLVHVKTLKLNGGISDINTFAFYNFDNLSDIYYNDFKSQWDQMEIGTGNDILNTVTIHYLNMKLHGHSISLDGDIAVNYYVEVDEDNVNKETAYMQFMIADTAEEAQAQKIFIKDLTPVSFNGKLIYVFKCRIAAKNMTSDIQTQLIDGENRSAVYTYSVKEYADYLIEHQDESQAFKDAVPLVKAMLQYGTYAQNYFSSTDVLEDLAVEIPAREATVTDWLEGVTFEGATLSLKSQTTLSLYFASAQGLTLSMDGKVEGADYEIAHNGDEYVIRIRNISAADLNRNFTVTVNGTGVITYSPMVYCYKAQTSSNTKLIKVVKALYLYSVEADKYFNHSGN